jgi:hypothetical protein
MFVFNESCSFHPKIICFSSVGWNLHDEFSSVFVYKQSSSFHHSFHHGFAAYLLTEIILSAILCNPSVYLEYPIVCQIAF